MFHFKNSTIFIWTLCILCIRAENCDPIYELPKWEPVESEPPGYLRLGSVREVEAALEAMVENRRENCTLTLFGNPFIKDGNCPSAASSYPQLRKFHKSRPIIKGGDESESIFFAKIFTGCYYAEMSNVEGKKWLWDPVFYNTSYHYYDTQLKCKQSEFTLENNEVTKELKVELEVPLNCLQLRCRLFEFLKLTTNSIDNLNSGNVPTTQDCWVKNIGTGKLPDVSCSRLDTHVTLSATPANEAAQGEGWSTEITWDFLAKGSTAYYVSFDEYNHTCSMSYGDLMTWTPVVRFGGIVHGF